MTEILMEEVISDGREKLTKAFKELRKLGFFARQNFWCCMTCGCEGVPDDAEKYVFYHNQDKEHLLDSGACHLCWGGGNKERTDKEYEVIGNQIIQTLNKHGIPTVWDGSRDTRIMITFPVKPVVM